MRLILSVENIQPSPTDDLLPESLEISFCPLIFVRGEHATLSYGRFVVRISLNFILLAHFCPWGTCNSLPRTICCRNLIKKHSARSFLSVENMQLSPTEDLLPKKLSTNNQHCQQPTPTPNSNTSDSQQQHLRQPTANN